MQFREEGNQLKANYMGTIHLQLKLEVVKLNKDFPVFSSRQGRWIRPRGNWTEVFRSGRKICNTIRPFIRYLCPPLPPSCLQSREFCRLSTRRRNIGSIIILVIYC